MVRQRSDLTLVPPAALKLSLVEVGGARTGDGEKSRTKPLAALQSPAPNPRKSAARAASPAPSWWTARARAGEVKPGFTKQDILRPAKDDPRAPGGIFEQVGGLLSELLERE
jgi:hypothetical protein